MNARTFAALVLPLAAGCALVLPLAAGCALVLPLAAGCALVLPLAAGCAQDVGPRLSSATPASAPHGATITIAGERMCAGDCARAAGQITATGGGALPPVQLPIVAFADTTAQVTIPGAVATGHVSIVLTVNDTASNALGFEVLP